MSDPSPHARETGNAGNEKGFYIRTYTGAELYWNDIASHVFDIRDIAHALSMNCRWTGHTRVFYSVAQHCVLASLMVPHEHALGALLHDACEAYVHDTPSPLKWYLAERGFTAMKELEDQIDEAIFHQFGIPYPMSAEIKDADRRMLATEHRDLMPGGVERPHMGTPYAMQLIGWLPSTAEQHFLERFHYLMGQ